jgi:ferredoxin-fold anticodon binding domain-containing protein
MTLEFYTNYTDECNRLKSLLKSEKIRYVNINVILNEIEDPKILMRHFGITNLPAVYNGKDVYEGKQAEEHILSFKKKKNIDKKLPAFKKKYYPVYHGRRHK